MAGVVGGAAAGWATKSLGGVAINGLNVAGKSAIGGFVTGAIGGAVGGFAGGLATGMIMTGDFDQALSMGLNSALYGGIAGGALGGYRGYKAAKSIGRNPWTGQLKPGINIRNGYLAGNVHPKTGVPFDSDGFPDFKDHLYKDGINEVMITPTGDRLADVAAANNAASYSSTPKNYTWHHHQNTGRMQLVKSVVHLKTGHTGGYKLWNY